MNFELAEKLNQFLVKNEIGAAIEMAETELKSIPETDFHRIIGKNLLHLSKLLAVHLDEFYKSVQTTIPKKKQGFFKTIFSKNESGEIKAFYCEMNGFTINYDRWFIDLFAYDRISEEYYDWLPDFYDMNDNDMNITGFEDIQKAFEDVHENNRFEEANINESYEICELLVILRLQELFRFTYKTVLEDGKEWVNIPMFVTAHDYELIYRVD